MEEQNEQKNNPFGSLLLSYFYGYECYGMPKSFFRTNALVQTWQI